MKVLIVTARFPQALGKGDSLTVYHLIKFLAPRHDIYLACFYSSDRQLEGLPELEEMCREVRCVKIRKLICILNMSVNLIFGHEPMQNAYYRSKEMSRVVDEMLTTHKPDLAYGQLFRIAPYLAQKREVKTVLAMQISYTLHYGRLLGKVKNPVQRIFYNLEYERVRRYEPRITREFDSCLLISKHDKESLDGHKAIENVYYSPHGIDVAYFTPSPDCSREDIILFCGIMEFMTNVDAITFFHSEVYPLIKKKLPHVRLCVAGRNPTRTVMKLAEKDPSVIVTGFVEDLRPLYEKAKVGIDPLRIGAGLQNKLLVGMCMGQPMVSTTIANEGIAGVPGKHLLIADKPEDFAEAVIELFENPAKAEDIAREARKYVEEKWTWEYYFELLEQHLIDLQSPNAR
jgi:sugar transferase (PEP-CTERM/EpsH1 system associated)